MWLVGVGGIYGCGYWVWLQGGSYIDFLIYTTYPYSSFISSFLQQHPFFLFIKKMFFVLVPVLFVIKFYVLNTFFMQYKHTYGRPTAAI